MGDLIRIHNLSKQYRRFSTDHAWTLQESLLHGWRQWRQPARFYALRDVSCSVAPGEMLGVIGHNGAGKSTLLSLMGGLGRPDEGSIEMLGAVRGLLDLGAGFHPELTGRENAFVSGIVSGLTRRQVKQQFDAIVAFAELEDAIDQPLRTFSTGMATRLAFSIAVHTSPDILLVDEVLAVGDTAFQQKCLQRIADIRKAGCAIVFVSHEMSLVANTCTRALWLDHGVVQEYGPPKAVVDHYLARLNSRIQSASAA